MSTRTRIFHRDELAAMGIPKLSRESTLRAVEFHRDEIEQRRWTSVNVLVFRAPDDGRIWRVEYLEGLTEAQEDTDPWDYETEIQAEEVAPYQVSHISWMTEDEAGLYPHSVMPVTPSDELLEAEILDK